MCGITLWDGKTLIRVMSIADETIAERAASEVPKRHQTGPVPRPMDSGLLGSEAMIFENWLKAHLCKIYQDVLGEPLPQEMRDIVEQFSGQGQQKFGKRNPSTIASRSIAQVP